MALVSMPFTRRKMVGDVIDTGKVVICVVDAGESGRLCRSYWRKWSAMSLIMEKVLKYVTDTGERVGYVVDTGESGRICC
jgi:hypothetical protein